MVVLIDANVIIDYLTERNGFFEDSRKVMKICSSEDVQGYAAFNSISSIWFILRKKSDDERRRMFKNICTILTVTGASHKDVVSAINSDNFKDFEDCLHDKCAVTVRADYIVTRNVNDFDASQTKAITSSEFYRLFPELDKKQPPNMTSAVDKSIAVLTHYLPIIITKTY